MRCGTDLRKRRSSTVINHGPIVPTQLVPSTSSQPRSAAESQYAVHAPERHALDARRWLITGDVLTQTKTSLPWRETKDGDAAPTAAIWSSSEVAVTTSRKSNHASISLSKQITDKLLHRCRCGYEYCYVCAVRWKECDCEQWDEARLLEDIAIRRARQQAGQFIFDRDECEHDVVWKKIRRAGACEHCGDWMRAYILECRDCGFRACRTCRTNF